ncbi:hypothetical protein [Rhizobium sp. RAF56]|uniref:hypothetical protein n=1 Tax=Rhizobium sp. RAF56 TaxID=3233062 RepID=UPI003F9D9D83
MPFTAKELASSDQFLSAILYCANELIAIYSESPRIASIFAAHQRWLLAQAGFALYNGLPDDPAKALYSARFVDFVVKHKIASRNTAVAFLQEMLASRFLRPVPGNSDRRTRLLEPTDIAITHFVRWTHTHLSILDSLDGKGRAAKLAADPSSFASIQPRIAKAILANEAVRNPGTTFNIFTWANSGGVIMDYLVAKTAAAEKDDEKIVIGPISMKEIRERFMISNTHLKRLLKQAAEMGSVGWTGVPGKSSFWLSREFVAEYWNYQAEKFAIIDAAAESVFG